MSSDTKMVICSSTFVCALILVLPFAIYSLPLGESARLTPFALLSASLFPIFFLECLRNNRFPAFGPLGNLNWLFIIVILCGGIATQTSQIVTTGIYGLNFFLPYLYVIYFLNSRKDVERAIVAFLVIGIVNAMMGWIEFLGLFVFHKIIFPPFAEYFGGIGYKAFGNLDDNGKPTGILSMTNYVRMFGFFRASGDAFGAFTLVSLGVALYLSKVRGTLFLKVLVLFFGLTLFVSLARNAYLGAVVMILLVYLFTQKRHPFYRMSFRFYGILFFIMSYVVLSYLSVGSSLMDAATTTSSTRGVHKTLWHLVERINFKADNSIPIDITIFLEHFWYAMNHCFDNFGLGLGGQQFDRFVYDRYIVSHFGAHSDFIHFLGDHGLWGFVIQASIVVLTFLYGIKTYYTVRGERSDPLPLYLTAIFIGLVITGIVRTNYRDPTSFIIGGLIYKLYCLRDRPAVSTRLTGCDS